MGHPQICVAGLDRLVDLKHPCFKGADLTQLSTLVNGQAKTNGEMSLHGTHVTSVIFGQPGSPVMRISPKWGIAEIRACIAGLKQKISAK